MSTLLDERYRVRRLTPYRGGDGELAAVGKFGHVAADGARQGELIVYVNAGSPRKLSALLARLGQRVKIRQRGDFEVCGTIAAGDLVDVGAIIGLYRSRRGQRRGALKKIGGRPGMRTAVADTRERVRARTPAF